MILAPGDFDDLLTSLGQQFIWRKAYACPCSNPSSGAANPACPVCSGKGWTWDATGVQGVAGVPNTNPRKVMAQFGIYEPGDAMLTIPQASPIYSIGHMDRVMALNSPRPFTETLVHDGTDQLYWYVPGIIVSRVFWLDPTGQTIIEGGLPTVNADGTLTWQTEEPPAGAEYSITGSRLAEYYVYSDIAANRMEQSGSRLPVKVHLRSFDLFGR